jgi:hypothetical protein
MLPGEGRCQVMKCEISILIALTFQLLPASRIAQSAWGIALPLDRKA